LVGVGPLQAAPGDCAESVSALLRVAARIITDIFQTRNLFCDRMRIDLDKLITQKEAAELRGCTPQAINRLVQRGSLKTVLVAGKRLVYRNEVEKFKPGVGGRPRNTPKQIDPSTRRKLSRDASNRLDKSKIFGKMRIDSDDMITQSEAARIRGVTHEAIRSLVKRGRFNVFKIGGKTFLSKREVERFKPSIGGRPRMKKPSKTKKHLR